MLIFIANRNVVFIVIYEHDKIIANYIFIVQNKLESCP